MYLRIAPELYLKRLTVGRLRAGLRDQPQFPQRGRLDAAQSRVHDARAVSGICRLHRPHGDDRDAVPGSRRHACSARARLDYQGTEIDLSKPFARMTIEEIMLANNPRPRSDVAARRRRICAASATRMKIPYKSGRRRRESCRSRFSRRPASTRWSSRPSPTPIPPRCRRSRGATIGIPSSPTAGSSSSAAASSPTASPSSMIPRTRRSASRIRSSARRTATRRRCTTTPITCARSSTACRRRPGWVSASTAW